MTIRVGVIGTGMIGQDHIRRISTALAGGRIVAVADFDQARARQVAATLPAAKAHASGQEVIDDPTVDAILVCSAETTHEAYVLGAIKAGKPVFCEKPLATTGQACLNIIEAEVAGGRRLVQVGFMRRYDHAYRMMKHTIDSGVIGTPLMMNSGHRNPSVPPNYDSDIEISGTAVHDVDIARWLFDDEVTEAMVVQPRRSSRAEKDLTDPLLIILRMRGGALVNIETSVNIAYGYDIRGEIMGESGVVSLAESNSVIVKSKGVFSGRIPEDWRERFIRAYDVELQEWLDACGKGEVHGPSSWDGYAATVATDAAIKARDAGGWSLVQMRDKPALYA